MRIGSLGAAGPIQPFQFNPTFATNLVWWTISGQTLNSSINPLGGCTVTLFQTGTNLEIASQVSDGGGNYAFRLQALTTATFYVVAYLPGSPDVAGTTVNTLVGV